MQGAQGSTLVSKLQDPTRRMCLSCSVVSDSLPPHELQPARLLSMGFSRQEHWSGLPCPSPDPEVESRPPELQSESLPSEPPGKPHNVHGKAKKKNPTIHKNLKINIQAETLSCVLSEVTFPNFLYTSHFPSQKGVWSQARSTPGGLGRKGQGLPWWPRG